MLSKKALDMLEYNGYSMKNDESQISFNHSSTDMIGLMIVLILTFAVVVFLVSVQLFVGLGVAVLAFLIFLPIVKRSKGKFRLIIDKKNKSLSVKENDSTISKSFQFIDSIFIHSKFVDEYSSAFKSTSEEHRITIGLEMDNKKLIPIFKLISDHAKPSKEMNEVHDYIKSLIS
ncbi:hypothetical protein [Ekhidna sp.]